MEQANSVSISDAIKSIDQDKAHRLGIRVMEMGICLGHGPAILLGHKLGVAAAMATVAVLDSMKQPLISQFNKVPDEIAEARKEHLYDKRCLLSEVDTSDLQPALVAYAACRQCKDSRNDLHAVCENLGLSLPTFFEALNLRNELEKVLVEEFELKMEQQSDVASGKDLAVCLLYGFPDRLLKAYRQHEVLTLDGEEEYTIARRSRCYDLSFSVDFYLPTRRQKLPKLHLVTEATAIQKEWLLDFPQTQRVYSNYRCLAPGVLRTESWYFNEQLAWEGRLLPVTGALDAEAEHKVTWALADALVNGHLSGLVPDDFWQKLRTFCSGQNDGAKPGRSRSISDVKMMKWAAGKFLGVTSMEQARRLPREIFIPTDEEMDAMLSPASGAASMTQLAAK